MIYLITALILLGVFAKKMQDTTNAVRYKRPQSHLPWPLTDVHHAYGRLYLYSQTGALWGLLWHFGAPWWHCTAVVALAWLLWRIIPEPYWWRR